MQSINLESGIDIIFSLLLENLNNGTKVIINIVYKYKNGNILTSLNDQLLSTLKRGIAKTANIE